MTPKEKAEEVVIKMYQPLPTSKEAEKGKEHLYYNQYNAAKHCALIAVDEIMEFMKMDDEYTETASNANSKWVNYWLQVKEEINKL